MQFSNDLAAGVTLVRPALQSPDYVAGTSGWAVMIDGSAEFNDVVIRGGTTVSGLALYYDGTPAAGNLIMSIAAEAGTDGFGNAYDQGLTVYDDSGSKISTNAGAGAATISFSPATVAGVTWQDGGMGQALASRLGTNTPQVFLSSPYNTAAAVSSSISLYGNPETSNGDVLSECFIAAERTTLDGDVWFLDQITMYDNDSFTSWTPTLTGAGAATLAQAEGWWQRVGKMVYVYAYFVIGTAGSGATQVTMNLPVTPWRGSSANRRQFLPGDMSGASPEGPLTAVIFAGGAGATLQRFQLSDGTDVTGASLTAGSIWIVEGWIREA